MGAHGTNGSGGGSASTPTTHHVDIANMAFNLGITRLKKFQLMLSAINAEDYITASKEGLNSRWAKQVHNRAKRLMGRLRDIDVTDKFDAKGRLKK